MLKITDATAISNQLASASVDDPRRTRGKKDQYCSVARES